MSKLTSLRLAVVGTGAFGTRYVDGLQRLPGVTVTWVCDLEEERCRQVAERYRVVHSTTDVQELCADPELDAVVVATPEAAHREVAVAALQAGKHVMVEKPLATSEEDGQAMIEAAERAGRLLLTAMLLRFDYRYALLKQRLPHIAPVRSIYAYRNFDRGLFETYSRTHSFVENAIHDIDLILWYVGSPVRRVHGFCRNTLGLPNPDINWGVLEFENGAIAVLQTSWLQPRQNLEDLQWNVGMQVMGDHGVLEVASDQGGLRGNLEGKGIVLLDHTTWAELHGESRGAFGALLRHWVACLRREADPVGPSPRQALEAVQIALRLVADARRRGVAAPLGGPGASAPPIVVRGSKPSRLRFTFPDEGVSAEAQLLWDQAPQTCRSLTALLPVTGYAHQAIYSGSESVLLLNDVLRLEPENATADVERGDVGFTWFAKGSSYGVDRDFAEICWFYDHDAQPRMWEGPVPVSIFARFIEPAQDFYQVCRRMRREGVKRIVVETKNDEP